MVNKRLRNFAAQPEEGGHIDMLTGFDLTTDVVASEVNRIFQKRPLFVDNCKNCKNMINMKNFSQVDNGDGTYTETEDDGTVTVYNDDGSVAGGDGGGNFWSGLNLGNLIQTGANIYGASQQQHLADSTAEIEHQKAMAAQAQAMAQAQVTAQTAQKSSIIKSYGMPIAIAGAAIIAGIAVYFVYKKKHIK